MSGLHSSYGVDALELWLNARSLSKDQQLGTFYTGERKVERKGAGHHGNRDTSKALGQKEKTGPVASETSRKIED